MSRLSTYKEELAQAWHIGEADALAYKPAFSPIPWSMPGDKNPVSACYFAGYANGCSDRADLAKRQAEAELQRKSDNMTARVPMERLKRVDESVTAILERLERVESTVEQLAERTQ